MVMNGDVMTQFPPIVFAEKNDDQIAKFQKLLDDVIVPWMLMVAESLSNDKKYLTGDTITIHDMYVAGLFTNFICNKNAKNADQLAVAYKALPERLKKYVADFTEEMKPYLDTRPNKAPI